MDGDRGRVVSFAVKNLEKLHTMQTIHWKSYQKFMKVQRNQVVDFIFLW